MSRAGLDLNEYITHVVNGALWPLDRKTRNQANKRLSCANMAENASKEPRNTAKSPYCWDMMRLLDNARKEGELTDVTLWVEGKTFPAHRCVLAASSQFFQGLFTKYMKENRRQS